jgi:hypothetical protein
MSYQDYLSNKKLGLTNNLDILNSNSINRITKELYQNGNNMVTINPDIFNSNIKYLYSIENKESYYYNNPNNNSYPLLIYNSPRCGINTIINDYSIDKINYFLQHLKNDNYDKVFSELSTEDSQKILYGLYKLRTIVSDCFSELIDLYENMFMSIKYFYFLHGELNNNELQCNKYKNDSEILNNIDKLKEYIKQMQLNLNAVTVVKINVSKLEIKPEYLKYIQLYGIPYKTIFDPVLLQQIIDEMNSNNL